MSRLKESEIVSPLLLQRFFLEAEAEGGKGQHYACILRDNGDLWVHHPGSPQLDPMQSLWAGRALRVLNRDVHHDGAWVVCFTHPKPARLDGTGHDGTKHREYARYALIWLDADSDPQFTMEWAESEGDLLDFADVVAAGVESTADKADGAWQVWHTSMRKVLDPKAGQTFRRAKGERPASARG